MAELVEAERLAAERRAREQQEKSMSLQHSDAEAAAVAVAPRVSLADIEAAIAGAFYFTAGEAIAALGAEKCPNYSLADARACNLLTICIVRLANGFVVIGKSAPASPENFNVDVGRKFAYEDAIRKLWPLMGFALRDRLHHGLPPFGVPFNSPDDPLPAA